MEKRAENGSCCSFMRAVYFASLRVICNRQKVSTMSLVPKLSKRFTQGIVKRANEREAPGWSHINPFRSPPDLHELVNDQDLLLP